jgi:glycosyltransferase involved in cell wall biosynthesis
MKTAICLIVRNEARDIAEWIAFHALVGFDTQIIFDNRSDDATPAIIQAAARQYDIRFHDWPNSSPRSQVLAYEAACEAYRAEFDWIAFVDSDEFVIPDEDMPINDYLARFDGFSGLAMPWAIYGSSGHEAFPEAMMLDAFAHRAPADFSAVRHVKCIIRPPFAGRCLNPHCFELRGNRRGSYCDTQGRAMQWQEAPEWGGIIPGVARLPPDYGHGRINHYFTRSRAHWLLKLKRGYPSDHAIRKMEEFNEYDRNEVLDPIAHRYLDSMIEPLARLEAIIADVL